MYIRHYYVAPNIYQPVGRCVRRGRSGGSGAPQQRGAGPALGFHSALGAGLRPVPHVTLCGRRTGCQAAAACLSAQLQRSCALAGGWNCVLCCNAHWALILVHSTRQVTHVPSLCNRAAEQRNVQAAM